VNEAALRQLESNFTVVVQTHPDADHAYALQLAIIRHLEIANKILGLMVVTANNAVADAQNSPISVFVPAWIEDQIEFSRLAAEWKKSRPRARSSAMDMARDPNYLRIIGMGERGIPCVLRQLELEMAIGEPDHWFIALWAMTNGQNPIPPESQGKIREMAQAWIDWGKRRGLIHAEGMGTRLSKSW